MSQIDIINPDSMFRKITYQSTTGHSQKLAKTNTRLDTRKYFFSQRVIDSWEKLPEEAVKSPTLLIFKKRLSKLGY